METLKEKTAKGLFWGGLSNGLQQLLNLAFGIFLARTLDSHDYGMVGMLAIFSAIAGTIQESGFTAALINKHDAVDSDYNAVFWFSTLAGMSMYILLFFCAPLIADFFGHEELTLLARVLFVAFVFSSTGIVHNAILMKEMRMKELAKISVVSLLLSGCVGVGMALAGKGYWSLALQTLTFTASINVLRWHYTKWRPTLSISFKPLNGMFSFSVKLLFTNIVNQINSNIFSAIIGRHYTPSDVGYYTQSDKWTYMGMQTVLGMTGGIAQPAFAEVGNDKERLCRVLRSLVRFTSFLVFPLLFGLALVAEELLVITIGTKWLPAVPLLCILCLKGAIMPLNNVYNQLAVSQGRSDIVFWCNLVFGLAQIALAFAMFRFGIQAMVTAYAAGYVVMLTVWQIIAKRLIGFNHLTALRCIVPYAVCAVVVLSVAYVATLSINNVYVSFILKVIISVALYVGVMRLCHSEVLDESLAFMKRKIHRH